MKAFSTICAALVCGSVVCGAVSTASASEHGTVLARAKKKKKRQRQADEEARQQEEANKEQAAATTKKEEKKEERKDEKKEEKKEEPKAETQEKPAAAPVKDHWREDSGKTSDSGPLEPKPLARILEPGHVDAKLLGNVDVLLAFIGVGAAVDVGIARAGSGSIALGLSGEYAFCASVCWALSSLTSYEFSQSQVSAWARGTYHLGFRGRGFRKLDLFPIVMAGPVFANATLKLGGTELKASDVGVGIGGGFGLSFFPTDSFFVGAEARFRYAAGSYEYEVTSGTGERRRTVFDGSTTGWSMTGADFVVALGARF